MVFALCFLTTISTAFEYQISCKIEYVDTITGSICKSLSNNTALSLSCDNYTISEINSTLSDNFPVTCELTEYLDVVPSSFGQNQSFKTCFFVYTVVVFTFLPFILLATFNFYLIAAVHRSHRLRSKMTNNSRPGDAVAHQENRITLILICVCVLFFILQSPTAAFMLYDIIMEPEYTYFIRGNL